MEALLIASHDHRNRHRYFGAKCGTSPTRVSCGRAFDSGSGLLPTPVTRSFFSERYNKSSSIPIPIRFDRDEEKGNGFRLSESWAGPAYSNSPPPSSLPLPNFSLPPKRLNFPILPSEIDPLSVAKSTPTSPTTCSPDDLFGTRTLCRILNLDVTEE